MSGRARWAMGVAVLAAVAVLTGWSFSGEGTRTLSERPSAPLTTRPVHHPEVAEALEMLRYPSQQLTGLSRLARLATPPPPPPDARRAGRLLGGVGLVFPRPVPTHPDGIAVGEALLRLQTSAPEPIRIAVFETLAEWGESLEHTAQEIWDVAASDPEPRIRAAASCAYIRCPKTTWVPAGN